MATKKVDDYSRYKQGVEVVQPEENSPTQPDIDIVVVPGLGAHPSNSWRSLKTKFNWITSNDGLIKTFPKARILLYHYQSKWRGEGSVDETIGNLARTLLVGLQAHREKCVQRPIIFLGHSMGGLVIAQAVNVAAVESREDFPSMYEATAACLFFGTPFQGAPVACAALLFADIAQDYAKVQRSKLVELMRPDSDQLRNIRREFLSNASAGKHKIDLICYYEKHATTLSTLSKIEINFLDKLFNIALPSVSRSYNIEVIGYLLKQQEQNYSEMVSKDSATLDTAKEFGLGRAHRHLVKFDSPNDMDYQQALLTPLKPLVRGAKVLVKKRFISLRATDPGLYNNLRGVLGTGIYWAGKREQVGQGLATQSWILNEDEYKQWLDRDRAQNDCLWICGPEGKGKTSAVIAATKDIEKSIEAIGNDDSFEGGAVLQAYYFCDATVDGSSAEALLKSLIWQMINGQESLSSYAKNFVQNASSQQASPKRTLSVENLWQCLQDILDADYLGTVYLVINNFHMLPESDPSTEKLLSLMETEFDSLSDKFHKKAKRKWLITGRNRPSLEKIFGPTGSGTGANDDMMQSHDEPSTYSIRTMDLDSEKYQDQLGDNLRQHAVSRIVRLGRERKYDRALIYLAGATLGERAENTIWIDVAVLRLASLPVNATAFQIRQVLVNDTPQELDALLDRMWMTIFNSVAEKQRLREMLRALVLTFEEPTLPELAMLMEVPFTDKPDDELRRLIAACKPLLLVIKDNNEIEKVKFANLEAKLHLERHLEKLLGFSKREIPWQHGYLAMRCFIHVLAQFHHDHVEVDAAGEPFLKNTVGEAMAMMEHEAQNEDGNGEVSIPNAEINGGEDGAKDNTLQRPPPLDYAVKHWLHHASKATLSIADTLSQEHDFWISGSKIRLDWLIEYNRLTGAWKDWPLESLTGLHVAASIGFRRLVAALLRNGYKNDINVIDRWHYTPLHLAAYFGRTNTVEELLLNGSEVDFGSKEGHESPLHMATQKGGTQVMEKLLRRGADINAISASVGPVINAAILSGNQKGAEMLIQKGANLDVEMDENYAPLALSALVSDATIFQSLLNAVGGALPVKHYDDALVAASEAGRSEIFDQLIDSRYQHSDDCYQLAFDGAADRDNWLIVRKLINACPRHLRLDCTRAFHRAATMPVDHDEYMELLWQYSNGGIPLSLLNDCLYMASDNEKLSTVKLLLGYGASPDSTGEIYGDTLTAAAFDGSVEIVQALVKHKVNVNNPVGWALQAAASIKDQRHMHIATILLIYHANVNAYIESEHMPQCTPLQAACEASWFNMAEMLLKKGADPNHGGGPFIAPLIAAAWYGESKLVQLLLDYEADVSVRDEEQATALIAGADGLPSFSLAAIIDAGAEVNAFDNDGNTALIIAAMALEVENVKLLIERGADIMHINNEGKNAVMIAFEKEYIENQQESDDPTEDTGENLPDELGDQQFKDGGPPEDAEEEQNPPAEDENPETLNNGAGQEEEQESCFHLLQTHVYSLMSSLKRAVDSGDPSALQIVRNAGLKPPNKFVRYRRSGGGGKKGAKSLPVRQSKFTRSGEGKDGDGGEGWIDKTGERYTSEPEDY